MRGELQMCVCTQICASVFRCVYVLDTVPVATGQQGVGMGECVGLGSPCSVAHVCGSPWGRLQHRSGASHGVRCGATMGQSVVPA